MVKNLVWDFLGRFAGQLISFAISVLLTRLLSPAEFGIMGMAMAVVTIAHIFLDLGFNKAIIQHQEITPVQYATIFYLNTVVAILLTVACYLLAQPLAVFYHQPQITPIFRVLSLLFLINGLNLVPAAILYRRLQFKLNSILNICSALIGGLVGVALAYLGYGVWSLVIQSLVTAIIILVTNFIYARWVPVFAFHVRSIVPLWAYGSRMFVSGLLDNVYTRLDIFIIGRIFNAGILGFYTRAQSMDNFVRQLSVNSIMGALFSYIARYQNDRERLRTLYIDCLNGISFVAIALSGTLFLISGHLFVVLFTARWLYAASLFRLMSIVGFAWPVSSLMCNIIAGVGNSKAFLKLEIWKKLLFLPVYFFGFLLGLNGFLWLFIAANFVGVALNAWFVSDELAVSTWQQLRTIGAYFIIGVAAVGISWLLQSIISESPQILQIIYLSLCFLTCYTLLTYLFNMPVFGLLRSLKQKLNSYIHDKRNKNILAAL